ncbi:hypothetical protein AVEN_199475-1 [Araneus ventricosus]|uniref:Uncharacterized protein n=1 Tax=Araneus ventricosus TaxID=182803 RepID=A0A4Y2VK18_ARAVE|nr:hypothetical protein AVEN_199475-1 [Araneus ventricosus]
MVVTHVRPSDTYRISQLVPRNGRPYATIFHVSQLKAWRCWNEDDDDSSENSDDEPEVQRPKRTRVGSKHWRMIAVYANSASADYLSSSAKQPVDVKSV